MAGIFDEIIGMEQRRSHGEYALDGIAPNTVAELEESMNAAERADMLDEARPVAGSPFRGYGVPSPLLGGRDETGYALEIIRGMQKADKRVKTKGTVARHGMYGQPDGGVVFTVGDVYGSIRVEQSPGGGLRVSAYTTGRNPTSFLFPSNIELKNVAGSALPKTLIQRMKQDRAFVVWDREGNVVQEEREPLTEGLKLGKPDMKVIDAFLDKKSGSSKKLDTDGARLDGSWMGGRGIARWVGGKIQFADLGSRAAQTVQRAVKKKAPKNWLGEETELTEEFGLLNERGEYVGHIFKDGKDFYVDTAFVQLASNNASKVLPGFTLRHLGFGEFSMDSPDGGKVEFDRMRGRDFPGQSGRSHKLYGDKKAIQKLIKNMVNKGHAQMSKKFKVPTPKAVSQRTGMKVRAKTRGALQQKLYDYFMDVYDQEGRQRPWRSVHSIAGAVGQKYTGPQFEKLLKSLDAMVKSGLLDKSPAKMGTPGKDDQYRLAEWAPARPIETEPEEVDLPVADLAILNAISEADGGVLSAPKIAEVTGLPKSDVRNTLDSMARENVVARTHPAGDVWRITHFGEACKAHGKKRKKDRPKRGPAKMDEGRMPSTADTPGLPRDKKEAKQRMKKILQIASKSVSRETLAKADWIERWLMDEFFTATKAWRKGTYSHKTADELDKYFAQQIVSSLSRNEAREPMVEKAYDVKTKPALNKVENAAMALYKGKGTLAALKAAVDAAAKAGATKNELVDAVGGKEAWNGFVREVKKGGLVEEKGSYKAQGPLEKMIGEMVRGQSGKWLSKDQMKAIVSVLAKKGITKPSKDSYDDIARIVGKTLASMMKKESTEPLSEGKVMGFDVVNIDVGPTTTNAEMINAITSNIKARKGVKLGRWVMIPPGRVFKLSEKYRGSGLKVPGAKEIEDAEVAIYGIPNFLKAWHKDW